MSQVTSIHMLLKCLLLACLLRSAAVAIGVQLVFQISSDKTEYFEGEPVCIRKYLKNAADLDMMVAEPDEVFVQFHLESEGASLEKIPRLCLLRAARPPDYGVRLGKGMGLVFWFSLNEIYPYGLPPGKYRLRAVYSVDETYHRCWKGVIWSNPLDFSVVRAPRKEEAAYGLYIEARDLINRGVELSTARAKLDKLLHDYPNSRYAKLGQFLKGVSFWKDRANGKQDFDGAIEAFRKFIIVEPNFPYYSTEARRLMAVALYNLGRKEEARSEFQKLPESHFKRWHLAKLDQEAGP